MIAKAVWLRYSCLCQIFLSLLEIMVLSVKIRPRNTRMFLCPGKCGCWIRVRLPFSSGFDSKTNFSYTWDLQAQSLYILSEQSPYRRKRSKERVRTLVILQCSHLKNMEEGIFKDSAGSKVLHDAKGKETLAASNAKRWGVGVLWGCGFFFEGGGVSIELQNQSIFHCIHIY